MSNAQNKFNDLHEQLVLLHQDIVDDAKKLDTESVSPSCSDPERVWSIIWDKPLWAARNRQTVEKVVIAVKPKMVGIWSIWGKKTGVYQLRKDATGMDEHVFCLDGEVTVLDTVISAQRHYSIYSAARYLWQQRSVDNHSRPAFEPAYFFENGSRNDRIEVINSLKSELGLGWGCVTILHLLSDFGIAAKPDRHVMRTLKHFDKQTDALPNSATAAVSALERIETLLHQVNEGRQSSEQFSLRYFDKVLMGFSEKRFL